MILNFPDLDTVRLALTTGAVPAAVALAPAVAGFGDDGRVWVEPPADPPRKAQAELRRLGAAIAKARGPGPAVEVSCWLELLPIQRSTEPVARPEQTPVLFEITEGEQLSSLVTEVLRLGNDRQGYRWLEDAAGKSAGRALLRVVGPPYYSLLRALDRDGQASAPTAYVEQAPRVWVQLGYRHPLADHVKPPEGQLLLLRPPRQWDRVADAPFRDIYEVLEFALPGQRARWREGELGRRLTVPLRLTRGGSADAAELWVLRDDPVGQLDRLVRESDDALLARLAFAVGERQGQKVIVLRTRPSKLAPPVLGLNALAFRQHQQKVPNLFLPVGQRLGPPLRRDAVRKALADDPAQVTWLHPEAGGGFTPESLPDAAFRPLSDWIDYVLEHDHQALQAWVESARFDFEAFVCDEDGAADRPKKPPRDPRAKAPPPRLAGSRPVGKGAAEGATDQAVPGAAPENAAYAEVVVGPPDELVARRAALEERFLAAEGGLDAPERQALWPELAALNAQLNSPDDAGVCWMNALWLGGESAAARAHSWFRSEARAVPVRKGAGWPKGRGWAGAVPDGNDLDLVLALEPETADVRALAAYVVWAGCQKEPPEALASRLGRVGQFLEAHERLVPVRAAWLAALALHRLAGGDALGLARARDRLLERLFRAGLRPEQDLPSFLRFSGPAGNQRFRTVRQWLGTLCDRAQQWVKQHAPAYGAPQTAAYVDLMFAYGLARLGEADASARLFQRAAAALGGQGAAHEFLKEAYGYRVEQARDGKPHGGPLPAELMERLPRLFRERQEKGETRGDPDWYAIDRLREKSRILEPDQKIRPYRHMEAQGSDLERALQRLPDVLDRAQAAELVRQLLRKVAPGAAGHEDRAHILRDALDQAPRVGEDFAAELLALAPAAFDALPAPAMLADFQDQAALLEKGLFVAAHFDRPDAVQQFVARFHRLLQSQQSAVMVPALESLAREALRGLRKLGMHKEIDQLLGDMVQVILRGGLAALDADWGAKQPQALAALLHVAAAWYYAGHDAEAEKVFAVARAVLLAPVPRTKDLRLASPQDLPRRTTLACAYASALSQAPVELAQRWLEELFQKLEGIYDTWTTCNYYLLSQLLVVEAVVRAVVSDDFTVGANVRRWLDDDEYLVRRRIHRDVRQLVSH